ncbi:hypothetical protein MN116_001045 [Schistosoma mekongi]|uniref:Uncharacterized protein n=1 Tax=Schistosoma mekongi TaxID=38744 RepID=A0AAE1ZKU8_SCHME|nr:hypothetical protein MN116_001045 [Schistosoma mekongi]
MYQLFIDLTLILINFIMFNAALGKSYEEILTNHLIKQPNLWLQPSSCPYDCQKPLPVNLTYNVIQVVKLARIYLLNQLGLMGLATIVAVMNNHFAQVNSRLDCFGNPFKKKYSIVKSRNVKLREESLLRKFPYDELRNYDDYHRNYSQKTFSHSPTSCHENFELKYSTDLSHPSSGRRYNRYHVTSIIDLLSILIYLTLSTWNWIYCFFVLPNK